jgi:putative nucleotidyltransferase with HDIG domain
MSYKIMFVDDEPANLRLLERLFRRDYQIITASSGNEALQLLSQHDVALIITDQRMPGMTGIELLKRTASFRPHMVRIILTGYTDFSALVEAINCGHVYQYVPKPWNNEDLRLTVERALKHYESNKSRHELEQMNARLSIRLQAMTHSVVRAIADALEAKDEHVYGHARRVSGYATAIGRYLQLDEEKLEQISMAAFLHDIGKIGTPDNLLLKPTALTDEEHAVMRLHSERGARMLAGVPDMEDVTSAVRHHHEHFDGSGYPESLKGEQIPLAARIILVADALTNPRPFREALDHEAAIEQLKKGAGERFDPVVVEAFCGLERLAKIRRSITLGTYGGTLSEERPPLNLAQLPFDELIRMVEREPSTAASLLHEANRRRDHSPMANIAVACRELGEEQVRAVVAQSYKRQISDADAEQLWERSLRCAEAARLLAEQTQIIDADDAYTLGLLHDIGEVLLRSLFPGEMERLLLPGAEGRIDREVTAFGVDHAQVGQWILESCGFPRHLAAAVQTHHDAIRINDPVALLLHVADAIALDDQPSNFAALDELGSDRLAMLRLSRSDLVRIQESTNAAIKEQVALSC